MIEVQDLERFMMEHPDGILQRNLPDWLEKNELSREALMFMVEGIHDAFRRDMEINGPNLTPVQVSEKVLAIIGTAFTFGWETQKQFGTPTTLVSS